MSEKLIYFDTPSVGLIPQEFTEGLSEINRKLSENASAVFGDWMANDLPKLRGKLSQFIDAPEDEIALLPNSSFGLSALKTRCSRRNTLETLRKRPLDEVMAVERTQDQRVYSLHEGPRAFSPLR